MTTTRLALNHRLVARMCVALGAALAAALPCAAGTITIQSIVGDKDGFNGAYNPATTALPHFMNFGSVAANGSGEAPLTDSSWFKEGDNVTYSHSFAVPAGATLVGATYEIVTFDNASEVQFGPGNNGRMSLDGLEMRRGSDQDFFFDAVGELFGGLVTPGGPFEGGAEIFTLSLDSAFFPLLMDGSASLVYTDSGIIGDGVAVDYSLLTLTFDLPAIPLPSAAGMSLAGLGLLAVRRRRG